MSGGTRLFQPWLRSMRTASANASSFVVTAPPSPVVTIFRGWKLRQPATPRPPHARPRYCAPSAPAAPAVSRADPPRRVLEHRHVLRQLVHAHRPAEEVHAEDQLRARADLDL